MPCLQELQILQALCEGRRDVWGLQTAKLNSSSDSFQNSD